MMEGFFFFLKRINRVKRTIRTYLWFLDSSWVSKLCSPKSFDMDFLKKKYVLVSQASLIAQLVKNLPAVQEILV